MKRVKFTIALFATLLLASCTTTKIMYEEYMNRQAEPVAISPYVMPTVADLEISDKKETVVSSFDNDLSKRILNNTEVEEWKNIVLTKMMKEFDSDVIVAPLFDITTSDDLKKVNVELTGYPARYTNFRNVQLADSAAMRVHNIEIARPAVISYGKANNVQMKTLKRTKDTFSRGGKTFVMAEAGVNKGVIGGDDMILNLQAIYGYEMNNYLSFGAGLGVVTYKEDGRYYYGDEYWGNYYDKKRVVSVPLLLNVNGYMFKSRVSPYYNLDLGFMLPLVKAKGFVAEESYYTVFARSYMKGLAMSPEIGMAFGNFRVGVEWKMLKSFNDRKIKYNAELPDVLEQELELYYDMDYVNKYKVNALFIKVGCRF